MVDVSRFGNSRAALMAGAAALVALGAAGGAGAVHATRPAVEMAPTVRTPIARLGASDGIVTVKGRVAEVYGDRFVVQDASGRAMVAAGREGRGAVAVGEPVTVQGRFEEGQMRASYLVGSDGRVAAVGPKPPAHGVPGGPGPHGGPGRDGPPPGCGPAPDGPPAVAPPPPANGAAPPPPVGAPVRN